MAHPAILSAHLTVTELCQQLQAALEARFPRVRFEGEISESSLWSSGHLYFTLKDPESQLACVMWRGQVSQLTFAPKVGVKVQCVGRPGLYHKNGRFQMVVQEMSPAGEGALQKKFQELKAKLEREGLFAEERKRELPFLPAAIAVVTSGQGAVIHDIMVRIQERMPSLPVYLADVRVQGEGAAEEVAQAIEYINSLNKVEVIIVARGGGSLEDLWAFNEERLVRAVFASRIPVISGVGHETDLTLCDLAADRRAPTPTAAAEIVVPRRVELLRQLDQYRRRFDEYDRWLQPMVQSVDELDARLARQVEATLERRRLRLSTAEARVAGIHPERIFTALYRRIDLLSHRLEAAGSRAARAVGERIEAQRIRLERASPVARIEGARSALSRTALRLESAIAQRKMQQRHQLDRLAEKLSAVNPRRVLERGYSIVETRGRAITSSEQVEAGDQVKVVFAHGGAEATLVRKW